MLFKLVKPIVLLLLSICCISCKENTSTKETTKEKSKTTLNDTEVSLLLGAIPPPAQMQSILSKKEYFYNTNFILKSNNQKNIPALLLGIYACDIVYTQIFEVKEDALISYKQMYKTLEKLKIENFLDSNTLKKHLQNNKKEALIDQLTTDFEDIKAFYIKKDSPAECLKIQAGEWIESLYLMTKNHQQKPSQELKDRIAEQVVISEILENLLLQFKHDKEINTINLELKPLFNNLKKGIIVEKNISQKDRQALIEKENGAIISTTENQVIVDKKDFDQLLSTIISARNRLIL